MLARCCCCYIYYMSAMYSIKYIRPIKCLTNLCFVGCPYTALKWQLNAFTVTGIINKHSLERLLSNVH